MTGKGILVALLLAGSFVFSPGLLRAGLNSFEHRIIRVAFMNGCKSTLDLEERAFRRLKQDPRSVKRFVESEADKYMKVVADLTRRESGREERGSSQGSFQGGGHW